MNEADIDQVFKLTLGQKLLLKEALSELKKECGKVYQGGQTNEPGSYVQNKCEESLKNDIGCNIQSETEDNEGYETEQIEVGDNSEDVIMPSTLPSMTKYYR